MNKHPAYLMVGTWLVCAALFLLLPFRLLSKQITMYGAVMLLAFLLAFIVGSLLAPKFKTTGHAPEARYATVDFTLLERLLMIASVIAIVASLMDIQCQGMFDLASSQEIRSERADALLKGRESLSSIWFQISFLTYPAGYVYIVAHIIYARRIAFWKLAIFGFLPILLPTIAMGGRAPLFYAMVLAAIAWNERSQYLSKTRKSIRQILGQPRNVLILSLLFVFFCLATYYFAVVFLIRSESVGGPAGMFEVAKTHWGVAFDGPFSDTIFSAFGESLTYLIFVFVWYLIQGLVMASHIFSAYDGPMQMGVYGIDIVSAIMRRLDPEQVTQGFHILFSLGTYGFLPSAFGSLYIDFGIFALVVTAAWGYGAALVHRQIKCRKNSKWLLLGPFVSAGIFFSLINTPIGFSNGFITHLWMLLAFSVLKFSPTDHCAGLPASPSSVCPQ